MASDQHIVDHICEQAAQAGRLTHRRMFGEYALYLDGKVVAFVCDNTLFVKPTDAGRALLGTVGTVVEGQAYPGSKMYFKMADEIEDRDLLARLLRTTADALPLPKPKAAPGAKAAAKAAAPKRKPRAASKRPG
jgi:TfoX/Sxy family transcriptional regulator of competence genes